MYHSPRFTLFGLLQPSSHGCIRWHCMLPAHARNTQYKTEYACRSQGGKRHRAQRAHHYLPRGFSGFPVPTPPSHDTRQSEFCRFLFRKRNIFLYCKNLVFIFLGVFDLNPKNTTSLYTSTNQNKTCFFVRFDTNLVDLFSQTGMDQGGWVCFFSWRV